MRVVRKDLAKHNGYVVIDESTQLIYWNIMITKVQKSR